MTPGVSDFLMPVAGGILDGIFGGNEATFPPEYQAALGINLAMIKRLKKRLRKPINTVAEEASYAGQVNQAGAAGRDNLNAQLGPNDTEHAADALGNLDRGLIAQQLAGTSQIRRDAQQRKSMLPMQIAQMAQGLAGAAAAGKQQSQGTDIGGMFGQIAQNMAQNKYLGRALGGNQQGAPTQGDDEARRSIVSLGDDAGLVNPDDIAFQDSMGNPFGFADAMAPKKKRKPFNWGF